MSKKKVKSNEKFYDELLSSLWTELIFFIPSKDIPTEVLTKYPKLKGIFDKVLVMDKRVGPMEYKHGRENATALQKGLSLDKNVFKLLKRKQNTDQNEFNFILEKYFEQIEFMFFISEWTNDNLTKNNIQNIDYTIKGLFLIQQKHFKKHFESITKHFYPTKQENPNINYDVIQIIETHFPELIKKYNVDEKEKAVKNNIEISTEAINTDKNQLLITEQDAEVFLLESVFNINQE